MESETPLHARKRSTGIQITDTSFFLSMENTPLLRSEVAPESHSGESKQTQTLMPSQLEQNQIHTSSVKEEMSVTPSGTTVDTSNPSPKPASQIMAAEGFLAICGGCRGKVLFPLGYNRVTCIQCGAMNFMSPDMIPMVTRKALLTCPKCHSSILYTIGCTHFQCTCGCVIEIPIPDYYIPHFRNQDGNAR